jgi:hypothetical protein
MSQPLKVPWYSKSLRFWPVEDKEAGGLSYWAWGSGEGWVFILHETLV